MYQYELEFSAMKGLGPEMITVVITIVFDDVAEDVPESVVKDWAINDAKQEMKARGFKNFTLIEVYNS